MGLARKNFLYSILISLLLVALVTGYFIFMLPSLYEAHMSDVNYQSVVKLHQAYMENGSYTGAEVRNPTGCVSISIPNTGNEVKIEGMSFNASITINDKALTAIVNRIAEATSLTEQDMADLIKDIKETDIVNTLMQKENSGTAEPIKIDFKANEKYWNSEMASDIKVYQVNSDLYVLESLVSDEYNQYINYLAVEKVDTGLVVTTLPVMAPKIGEIRPVVFNSLPMITVVVFLLVLLFSQLYSAKIVNPIITISHYAGSVIQFADTSLDKLVMKRNDEIGELADAINEMYKKLWDSYNELQEKNLALAEENKRQEVFMRASSHQLKTPIAAALLLTDGMINEIGKYQDIKTYLPQVKSQLLSMKKMVDDILYVNGKIDDLKFESIDLTYLTKEILKSYNIQIEEKNLKIVIEDDVFIQQTDGNLQAKILDNLISNAVNYTSDNEMIRFSLKDSKWIMINYGCAIPEDLLPDIFEPFVSGNHVPKGHGLGLYVSAYYAGLLGQEIHINNCREGVISEIDFGRNA